MHAFFFFFPHSRIGEELLSEYRDVQRATTHLLSRRQLLPPAVEADGGRAAVRHDLRRQVKAVLESTS